MVYSIERQKFHGHSSVFIVPQKLKVNRQRLKFVMRKPELKIPTLAKWLISPLVRVIF